MSFSFRLIPFCSPPVFCLSLSFSVLSVSLLRSHHSFHVAYLTLAEDAMAEMKHTVSGGRHAGHHSFQVLRPIHLQSRNHRESELPCAID